MGERDTINKTNNYTRWTSDVRPIPVSAIPGLRLWACRGEEVEEKRTEATIREYDATMNKNG